MSQYFRAAFVPLAGPDRLAEPVAGPEGAMPV